MGVSLYGKTQGWGPFTAMDPEPLTTRATYITGFAFTIPVLAP